MKLLRMSAENFGSYKTLDVNLTGQGLTLVQGPTGCGKSTLLSLPCWILFGQTDKGGSVEEDPKLAGQRRRHERNPTS